MKDPRVSAFSHPPQHVLQMSTVPTGHPLIGRGRAAAAPANVSEPSEDGLADVLTAASLAGPLDLYTGTAVTAPGSRHPVLYHAPGPIEGAHVASEHAGEFLEHEAHQMAHVSHGVSAASEGLRIAGLAIGGFSGLLGLVFMGLGADSVLRAYRDNRQARALRKTARGIESGANQDVRRQIGVEGATLFARNPIQKSTSERYRHPALTARLGDVHATRSDMAALLDARSRAVSHRVQTGWQHGVVETTKGGAMVAAGVTFILGLATVAAVMGIVAAAIALCDFAHRAHVALRKGRELCHTQRALDALRERLNRAGDTSLPAETLSAVQTLIGIRCNLVRVARRHQFVEAAKDAVCAVGVGLALVAASVAAVGILSGIGSAFGIALGLGIGAMTLLFAGAGIGIAYARHQHDEVDINQSELAALKPAVKRLRADIISAYETGNNDELLELVDALMHPGQPAEPPGRYPGALAFVLAAGSESAPLRTRDDRRKL